MFKQSSESKVYIIDLTAYSLVGIAAIAGAYAIYLFDTKVSSGLAKGIVDLILR